MGNARLDSRLVADGLAPTRSRARDLILRGFVRVNGAVCEKPGQDCSKADIELVDDAPRYVSRGAEKLLAALDHFAFDPAGRIAMDIGASTGGFTQLLLNRGAEKVYAIDVGRAQLHLCLREDPRVVSLEKQNARTLTAAHVAAPITALVADVSFISLTKALGPALALTAPGCWLAALIKPQFEVGPDGVRAGGIVRDEAARQGAIDGVTAWLSAQDGWRVIGVIPSPILGDSGNAEFLIGAVRNV